MIKLRKCFYCLGIYLLYVCNIIIESWENWDSWNQFVTYNVLKVLTNCFINYFLPSQLLLLRTKLRVSKLKSILGVYRCTIYTSISKPLFIKCKGLSKLQLKYGF